MPLYRLAETHRAGPAPPAIGVVISLETIQLHLRGGGLPTGGSPLIFTLPFSVLLGGAAFHPYNLSGSIGREPNPQGAR